MSKTSNKRINSYFITIVITLGGLLFGYDTGFIVLIILFVWKFIYETKGKTLEEMESLFELNK